jgi:nitrite reductase/ring-hydroxylating ferredoxin subunit
VVERDGGHLSLFVVRKKGRIYAYENDCPHQRVPLNWLPDEFLDAEQAAIECSTHRARFRIEDGYCTVGPCVGRSLTPVPVAVKEGEVILLRGEVPVRTVTQS